MMSGKIFYRERRKVKDGEKNTTIIYKDAAA